MQRVGGRMKGRTLKVSSNSTDAPPGVGTSYLAQAIALKALFVIMPETIKVLSPK